VHLQAATETKGAAVLDLLHALEEQDSRQAESFLTDDCRVHGLSSAPLDGAQFIGVMRELVRAMPDFTFNAAMEQGEPPALKIQMNGTQVGTLDLRALGFPVLKATGVEMLLPGETVTFSMRGGRIDSLHFETVPGGGIEGILEQLKTILKD
jgi:hypothetical protein